MAQSFLGAKTMMTKRHLSSTIFGEITGENGNGGTKDSFEEGSIDTSPFRGNVLSMNDCKTCLPLRYGYIQDIEISPNYAVDQTLYAVRNGEGVYRTTDGGAIWEQINSSLPRLHICDMAISPNYAYDNTVVVLTQAEDPNSYACLMVSTDAGETWLQRAQFQSVQYAMIRMSPNYANDNTIFLFSGTSIKYSTDAGYTWPFNPNSSVVGNEIYDIAFSPTYATDGKILICTGQTNWGGGLYESKDRGNTWKKLYRELTGAWGTAESLPEIVISPNYSADGTFYTLLWQDDVGAKGLWYSTDEGQSFDSLMLDAWGGGASGLTNRGVGDMVISPDYKNDNTLFLGTAIGLYVSNDKGKNWDEYNNGMGDIRLESMAISPNYAVDRTIFVGTHKGVYKTTSAGTSWIKVNRGIPENTLLDVSSNPYAIETLPCVVTDKKGGVHMAWMSTSVSPGSPDGVETNLVYRKMIGGQLGNPIEIRVNDDQYYTKSIDMATDADGNVHIVFVRADQQLDADGYLYYTNNIDGSFDTPKIIYGVVLSKKAYHPTVAVTSDNVVHIIYRFWELYYTNNASGTFMVPVMIDGTAGIDHPIAKAHNYTLHIVGVDYNELYYIKGNGGAFTTPELIADDHESFTSDIDVDKNGKVHVVYRCESHNMGYIENTSGSFVKQRCNYYCDDPCIDVDESGVAHVVFHYLADTYYATNRTGIFEREVMATPMPSAGDARPGKRGLSVYNGMLYSVLQARANRIYGDLDHDIYLAEFTPFNVLSPNGGESWTVGSTQQIQWSSTGVNNIMLEYSTDTGTSWQTIESSVPAAQNSYSWTIPATPSSECKVRIADVTDAGLFDESDATFKISQAATLTLTAPNGREKWTVGSTEQIQWSSTGVSAIRLEYSINNGAEWETISEGSPSTGLYQWSVPNTPTMQAKIKISDADDPSLYDVSDDVFIIDATSGIRMVSESIMMDLYPMPVYDELVVSLKSITSGVTSLTVYDVLGNIHRRSETDASIGQQIITIDVNNLTRGLYFIKVISGSRYSIDKFTKY